MKIPRIGKAKKGGLIPRSSLYAVCSKYGYEAIAAAVNLMRTSNNESIRLGAARLLLDKCLPDVKVDITTNNQTDPLIVEIIEGQK